MNKINFRNDLEDLKNILLQNIVSFKKKMVPDQMRQIGTIKHVTKKFPKSHRIKL